MDCCGRRKRKAATKRGRKDRRSTSRHKLKTLVPTDDYRASPSVAASPQPRITPVIRPNDDRDDLQPRPAAATSRRRDKHRFLYRVRGIPSDYTKLRLKADLSRAFDIGDDSLLRIRSLSFDIPRLEQSSICTAIISFGKSIEQLREKNLVLDVGGAILYFDTVFNGFTPLSPMETSSQQKLDCIIIPGWGGHPLGSFMAESSPYVWLIDNLARNFPQLRIWTYGYSPQIQKQTSGEDVYEFADSFVRLLRGLRRKFQAIIRQRSSQDATDRLALDSTFGAMFFAVPNSGMDVEALASMVHDMPARTTLADLDKRIGHRQKRKLHSDFCSAFDFEDALIARFYELDDSPTVVRDTTAASGWSRSGPPKLLVDFESATKARPCDRDDEWICGLQGNHSTLVKLPEYYNENYDKIADILQKFSDRAPAVIDNRLALAASKHQNKGRPGLSLDSREIVADGDYSKQALQREREECLESLSFPQMNARERRVDDRAENTCQWLLQEPQWVRWFDENRKGEFLWIKGKPGSGKSTLMKYISQTLKGRADSILVSYFFDARGSSLEKSSHGLFSSMLHGLLSQVPHLLDDIISVRQQKTKREELPWQENELKEFFCRAVTSLGEQQVYIQIDALDECHEVESSNHANTRELLRFFEDILLTTAQASNNVHLVVSSRHYPNVTVTRGITTLEIVMEKENHADIKQYVTSWLSAPQSWELGGNGVPSPSSSPAGAVRRGSRRPEDMSAHTSWSRSAEYAVERESLVDEVVKRSGGIFLWVKLVVRRLKTAQDRGKPTRSLRRILAEIPSDLTRLFTEMMRDIDGEDREDTEKLIRWVLFAFNPLDRASLQIAMAFDTDSPAEIWKNSPNYMSEVKFSNRVLDLSRGLIEFRESHDKFWAYFIHDTVRTFFLQSWNVENTESKSSRDHFLLMVSCLNFLRTNEMKEHDFHKTGRTFQFFPNFEAAKMLDRELPLWRYATSKLFLHARLADPALSSPFLSEHLGATWPLDRTSIYWVWENFYYLYAQVEKNHALTEYKLWGNISSIGRRGWLYIKVSHSDQKVVYLAAMDIVFYAALLGLVGYLDILLPPESPDHVEAVGRLALLIGNRGRLREKLVGDGTLGSRNSFQNDEAIGYPELVAMALAIPNYEPRMNSLLDSLPPSVKHSITSAAIVGAVIAALSTYRPPW